MQELNELKNLVIQSLEANGSLSNIRAQIRASVFKVIDQQDNTQAPTKKPSPFSWENPKCQKLLENENGVLILQLIKEFLQFYSMDYSNSVFSSESNLREEVKRDKLNQNLNINKLDSQKPLLLQLVEDFKAGNSPSQQAAPTNANAAAQQQEVKKQAEQQLAAQKVATSTVRNQNEQQQQQQQQPSNQQQPKYQDLIGDDDFEQSLDSQSDQKQANNQPRPMTSPQNDEKSVQSLESTSEKKALEEAQQFIQKSKNQMHTGQIGQLSVSQQQQQQQQQQLQQQQQQANIQQQNKFNPNLQKYDQEQFDNYEDDDVEGVEEQLHDYQEDIDVDDDIMNSKSKNAGASNQSHFEESEDYIGQSSKGHDISVDSYALENFDHIENVEDL